MRKKSFRLSKKLQVTQVTSKNRAYIRVLKIRYISLNSLYIGKALVTL